MDAKTRGELKALEIRYRDCLLGGNEYLRHLRNHAPALLADSARIEGLEQMDRDGTAFVDEVRCTLWGLFDKTWKEGACQEALEYAKAQVPALRERIAGLEALLLRGLGHVCEEGWTQPWRTEVAEMLVVECPACSKAGGAERGVQHLPPVCSEEPISREGADHGQEATATRDKPENP